MIEEFTVEGEPIPPAEPPDEYTNGSRRLPVVKSKGRVPPLAIEAEEAVLGAMMVSDKARTECLDILRADDFFKDGHRKIFEAASNVDPCDPITVAAELGSRLESVGGTSYLAVLTGQASSASNAAWHARIVSDKAAQRRMIEVATKVAEGIYDYDWSADKAGDVLTSTLPKSAAQMETRAQALDVVDRAAGVDAEDDKSDHIAVALWRRGAVLLITGEEGDGKTIFAEQLCRELVRRERLMSLFDLGDVSVERVLFIDTEMEDPEINARCAEMDARGLEVPAGRMFWLSAGALDLAHNAEDRALVLGEIARLKPDIIWIDAAGNAVDKPTEDESVNPFFNWLSMLIRVHGLHGVGLSAHPRKRPSGEYGRRFDDLFGAREWKGRVSKAVYLEGSKITAWKDRGGGLRRLWPPPPGKRYPQATLERPGFENRSARPFSVHYNRDAVLEDLNERLAKAKTAVLDKLRAEPDLYTKNKLSESCGVRKDDARTVIETLMEEGVIGPRVARAKIRILNEVPGLFEEEE